MSSESKREIYFSSFMFTADLRPEDPEYTEVLIKRLRTLSKMGYDGFDLHIADRPASVDHGREVDSYKHLKRAFDEAGLEQTKVATNVGTTQDFDPTSPCKKQREEALSYLKSRVEITSVLNGESSESIMSGPFLYPYGVFPLTDADKPIWSDALQEWMKPRYEAARPIFRELAEYAHNKKVKLAIEPVKNWETPPPNMVSEVLDFLDGLGEAPCGITIDTAQVLMESQGPSIFKENVTRAAHQGRLTYVHISPPDRGAVHDSWIPWDVMLGELEMLVQLKPVFRGPYLIEIFNAIPPFDALMRMSRRRFWWPDENPKVPEHLNAHHIAEKALHELREQIARVRSDILRSDAPLMLQTPAGHKTPPPPETVPGKVTSGMGLPSTSPVHSGDNANAEPLPPLSKSFTRKSARLRDPIILTKRAGNVRIHTFIASFTEDNIANATHIVESQNTLVVVDGQFLAPYAVQFRAYADDLGKPIERVYLSHRHPDHWFGLATAFSDKAIFALKKTRDVVRATRRQSLADHLEKMGDLAPKTVDFPMRRVKPGVKTIDGVKYVFEEELAAEVEVQLTIKLPDLGVAIVQDLIYSGTHLYLTKQMDHWRQILQKLLLSDYETFLPGHGLPADKNEVAANSEYLAAAQQALDGGLSKDDFQEFLLRRYPGRLCPGIFAIYLPRLFDGASQY